ncbi:GTP-binding protein Di-Ras2-like [Centruroides sculpturatus]|uniref:GTP-binding protein Di-Ras2-like n=1 Tax=Centruroides sculpturatus TaxID=218467 RepID=UPI000C6EC47C|nr:GTP-binding protein Di-Ras2-like [Centruroides sculpturatus]
MQFCLIKKNRERWPLFGGGRCCRLDCIQVINCNKNICTLQITDTTGSHQFPAMQRLNISKAHAFILVYSVTTNQSLEELSSIFNIIKEIKGNIEGIPIMLVGNKCDETDCREIDFQLGLDQAMRWGCGFMETSAKTNYHVKELFQELLNMERRRKMGYRDNMKNKSRDRKEKILKGCLLM